MSLWYPYGENGLVKQSLIKPFLSLPYTAALETTTIGVSGVFSLPTQTIRKLKQIVL